MKEAPFKSTIAGGENFNSDRKTFGLEKSLPPVKLLKIDNLEKSPKRGDSQYSQTWNAI